MSRGRACSVVGLLLLLQCNGLSLHNCGGHNESNAGQARQNIKRKASSGSALSANMGRYPGSSSNVAGVVSVTVSGGFLQVSYTLTGLNAQLESGGLHIHSGSGTDVCTDASLPGDHYHAMGVTDPWMTYWTKTAGSTTATGSFSVGTTGFDTLAENELHAVVVHGAGRFRPYARVGCGVLQYIGGAASSAVGDPHLQNVHGERFDLMKPGKHLLIQIPRKSSENTLLRVEAEARQLGGLCADMYFQDLNITGAWVEATGTGGLRFQAEGGQQPDAKWQKFGKIQLKVARGHTQGGLQYLNFYVKHLGNAGFAVGGLLGEDDHEEAAMPQGPCAHHVSLLEGDQGASVSSFAEASFA